MHTHTYTHLDANETVDPVKHLRAIKEETAEIPGMYTFTCTHDT